MKAILEFNLPEDTNEHKLAINAPSVASAIWNFDQHLRSVIKYGDKSELEENIYQEIRDKLYEMFDEYNLVIDDFC